VAERLVFVSHSGPDTWVAKQIAREISACGATPFLDEAHIEVGADFEEDILAFLEKAHELVVLLTPWALERPYVWAEIGADLGAANADSGPLARSYGHRVATKARGPHPSQETRLGPFE